MSIGGTYVDIGGPHSRHAGAATRLFIVALIAAFSAALLGALVALMLVGPAHWLTGTMIGAGLGLCLAGLARRGRPG